MEVHALSYERETHRVGHDPRICRLVNVCVLSSGLPGFGLDDIIAPQIREISAYPGITVTLALTEHRPVSGVDTRFADARATAVERVLDQEFDVAIATDWMSTSRLFEVAARRRAYWVDHLAHERLRTWQVERMAARLSYDLPVDFILSGVWLAERVAELRPDARSVLVRPGLDKVQCAVARVRDAALLHILVVELRADDPGAGAWRRPRSLR